MDWASILTIAFLIKVLAASVQIATPLVLVAVGEIFVERSGTLNLGIEGMMLFSGFAGFSVAVQTDSLWLGVAAGILVGALMGLFFGFMTITLRSDQIVTGLSILILSSGAAIYFYRIQFNALLIPQITPFREFTVPILAQIPFLGPVLFEQNVLTYLMYALVPIATIIMYRTRFGLRVNAIGEFPAAADDAGINVYAIRYITLIIGGALAGLAGAYFPLAELGFYANTMVGGRGFIALALVVFGRWNPLLALVGGLLFGSIDALQIRFQLLGATVPPQFLIMMPYVLTILALLFGKGRKTPAALTIPYKRE
jgi:general nucleoside transport system permease protein